MGVSRYIVDNRRFTRWANAARLLAGLNLTTAAQSRHVVDARRFPGAGLQPASRLRSGLCPVVQVGDGLASGATSSNSRRLPGCADVKRLLAGLKLNHQSQLRHMVDDAAMAGATARSAVG